MTELWRDLNEALLVVNPDDIVHAADILGHVPWMDKQVFIIGNGGSAGIASHMAADLLKNGHMRASALNDPATITAITNDEGYASVYATQLRQHGKSSDVLFAISSSGRSVNILSAVWLAKKKDMEVITLSGFDEDNPLRTEGIVNFYIPSHAYGTVEVAHHAIMHAIATRVINAGSSHAT